MHKCWYVSSSGGRIAFDGDSIFVGTGDDLRSSVWSYSLDYRNVSALTRPARKATVEAAILDLSEVDRLRRAAELDAQRKQPGSLYVDGWFQRCYILAIEPSEIRPTYIKEDLEIVLLDGYWGAWETVSFWSIANDPDSEWLDLPTDAPFDLMQPRAVEIIKNDSHLPSPIKLTLFGPAVNPYVIIGSNRYALNLSIPDGARAEIDATVFPRTIKLVSQHGDETDEFAAGVRGSGVGGGEYIFEDLQPGTSSVAWPGSFGFELSWLKQEGSPPCAS